MLDKIIFVIFPKYMQTLQCNSLNECQSSCPQVITSDFCVAVTFVFNELDDLFAKKDHE